MSTTKYLRRRETSMALSEETTIPEPIAKVADNLNDVAIVTAYVPRCQELVKHSSNVFEVELFSKLGQ